MSKDDEIHGTKLGVWGNPVPEKSSLPEIPPDLMKRVEAMAEEYGKNNRHLKTSQHFIDGAQAMYAELAPEIEDLKVYKRTVYDYVQGTGNTSPKTLGYHIADALVMDHKHLKTELTDLKSKYERAEKRIEKLREALGYYSQRYFDANNLPLSHRIDIAHFALDQDDKLGGKDE